MYDADGNLIEQTTEFGANTYSSHGQLLGTISESDFDADNTIDFRSVVTIAYDGVKH